MKKAIVLFFMLTLTIIASIGVSEATPKSISLRTPDREVVWARITQSMQSQGYKLMASDPYRLVFEKKLGNLYEGLVYRDPWILKTPVLRKTWSLVPGPGGLDAITDTFIVSSARTDWEKVYDVDDVDSFTEHEKFDKEKLYDLYDLKASVENLDRYFLMRVSGLFPELKPDFPKADMLMEGNRVIAVIPDGLAGRIGIRAGDIIYEMNGNPVAGPGIVELIDSRLIKGNRVMLMVQRNNAREVVTLMETE
jgi:hypothetical protein